MFPTDAQRVVHPLNYPNHSAHPTPHPAPHQPPLQHPRPDRKLAFGQLRQAVSSRLCDLLGQLVVDRALFHHQSPSSWIAPPVYFSIPIQFIRLLPKTPSHPPIQSGSHPSIFFSFLFYFFFYLHHPGSTVTTLANPPPTDEAGIHATRVVSGRRFVRWDTVPKLLAQQNAYISCLPYEFFFAKAVTTTSAGAASPMTSATLSPTSTLHTNSTGPSYPPQQPPNEDGDDVSMHSNPRDNSIPVPGSLLPSRFPSGASAYHPHSSHYHETNAQADEELSPSSNDAPIVMSVDAEEVAQTLIAQLHAQPLNINILSWKKQTIEYILDGLEKRRIRILSRPENRDVVFELELPLPGSTIQTADIPRWPDVYPSLHADPLGQNQPSPSPPQITFPMHSGLSNPNSALSPLSSNFPSSGGGGGGSTRNPRPDSERKRKLSTNTNASTATGSAGSEATTPSWSGNDAQTRRQMTDAYGDVERRGNGVASRPNEQSYSAQVPDKLKQETMSDETMYDIKGHGHGHEHGRVRSGSMTAKDVAPLVHNHTLTPSPLRSHPQDFPRSSSIQSRHVQLQSDNPAFDSLPSENGESGVQPSRPLVPGVQYVSRTILSPSTSSGVGSFLTTPTPTKKWTRRSSPDRIFMNTTLNGILRAAGMPIPRQKDDASRLPWSSIPQFLAENGMYICGWPEANLPWLYSGDMGANANANANANMAGGGGANNGNGSGSIGEWRDRIDWKSSPSQRSYKPLAQALRNGDIRILPRPRGRDVLFEVRDAQGRCYDSTLGLSDEWKKRWMHDYAAAAPGSGSPPSVATSSSGAGEPNFVDSSSPIREGRGRRPGIRQHPNTEVGALDDEMEEKERGRPGYHSRSTSYSRSGTSRTRNLVADFELPSPTETTTSSSSGATKRQGHHRFSRGYHPSRSMPQGAISDITVLPPRAGYQKLAYPPSEPSRQSPLGYSYTSKVAPNQFHEMHHHSRLSTPPVTSHERDAPSAPRFPHLAGNRQHLESGVRFQHPSLSPAEVSNEGSCRNTPSPDSSARQRTVSLGTSSASTGSSGVPGVQTLMHPPRGGRYNLPSLSHGVVDVAMDLDDPSLNRLPPIHLKSDGEGYKEDESPTLSFPAVSPLPFNRIAPSSASSGVPPATMTTGSATASSLPTHFPSPLSAFSRPTWSATERIWKLTVLDHDRALLPPVGDTILWDPERSSWKLTWVANAESLQRQRSSPIALWSAEQDAWILDS